MARPAKAQSNVDDDNAEFSFDPGTQIELEIGRHLLHHGRAGRIQLLSLPRLQKRHPDGHVQERDAQAPARWRLHRPVQRGAGPAPRRASLSGALLQLLGRRATYMYMQRRDGPTADPSLLLLGHRAKSEPTAPRYPRQIPRGDWAGRSGRAARLSASCTRGLRDRK